MTSSQPKYWGGCVPGIPGGVDASDYRPILSVFPALIVHSELKSVHPGFLVAFIFKHKSIITNNVVFNLFALTCCYFG